MDNWIKQHQHTLKEAWEKSLLKWELRALGFAIMPSLIDSSIDMVGEKESCGLCNYFDEYFSMSPCDNCPIGQITREGCNDTPFDCYEPFMPVTEPLNKRYAWEELVYLLRVRKETL